MRKVRENVLLFLPATAPSKSRRDAKKKFTGRLAKARSRQFNHQQPTMSGRGKGGKGLGKGGAKRHRKVLRDNIQGAFTVPSNT